LIVALQAKFIKGAKKFFFPRHFFLPHVIRYFRSKPLHPRSGHFGLLIITPGHILGNDLNCCMATHQCKHCPLIAPGDCLQIACKKLICIVARRPQAPVYATFDFNGRNLAHDVFEERSISLVDVTGPPLVVNQFCMQVALTDRPCFFITGVIHIQPGVVGPVYMRHAFQGLFKAIHYAQGFAPRSQ